MPDRMLWIMTKQGFLFPLALRQVFTICPVLDLRKKLSFFNQLPAKIRRKLLLNSHAGLRCLYAEFVQVTLEHCITIMSESCLNTS